MAAQRSEKSFFLDKLEKCGPENDIFSKVCFLVSFGLKIVMEKEIVGNSGQGSLPCTKASGGQPSARYVKGIETLA